MMKYLWCLYCFFSSFFLAFIPIISSVPLLSPRLLSFLPLSLPLTLFFLPQPHPSIPTHMLSHPRCIRVHTPQCARAPALPSLVPSCAPDCAHTKEPMRRRSPASPHVLPASSAFVLPLMPCLLQRIRMPMSWSLHLLASRLACMEEG
jgi:hypothetical protein